MIYLRTRKHLIKIIWKAYFFKFVKINNTHHLPLSSIVYIADTIIWPGCLVDRLKGIISLYDYAQEKKMPFYIFLDQKNDFTTFLQINQRNIHLTELNRNLRKNQVHFFIDNTITQSYNHFFSSDKTHHVYTNLDLLKYKYGDNANKKWRFLFNELFSPSDIIQVKVDEIISGRTFIVCAFRFRSRMGDFKDDGREWDDETKESEVRQLNHAVDKIISEFPNHMVYIASDSTTYLKQLIKLDPQRFFYNPNSKADINDMERSIIEFLVLSKGKKVFQFKRPSMFAGAFSLYAAIIGSTNYKLIKV